MKPRVEDRRSCHAISFVLGLAVAAKRMQIVETVFSMMLALVTPVPGQKPN